ncbi:hypothetical protein HII28_10440 [Planctomonas sp. JC2975]|uniref:hypothetical protein n=1 Tax=Planctomonas sp. JC2975 TaxID=2729626 RepID=UPI001474DCC9|nr:hypothetical protein [Planctomonas sp. JC2975]NNC12293.1 hypothetical protein [Planctomonas sp. JC2975]
MAGRFLHGPNESDQPDDDFSSLFGDVDDDLGIDDEADGLEPMFPAPPPVSSQRRPDLPDPRAAPPNYDIPELSMPIPPRPAPAPRGGDANLPAEGGGFFWGLTPNEAPDPRIHGTSGAEQDHPASDPSVPSTHDDRRHRGLVPPSVPLAPYVPPLYEQPTAQAPAEPPAPPAQIVPPTPPVIEPWRPEPTQPEPAQPESTQPEPAPGTVSLPWVATRRSPEPDPSAAAPQPPVQPAWPSLPQATPPVVPPAAPPVVPPTAAFPWDAAPAAGAPDQTSAWPASNDPAPDAAQPAASSSWSLFGDLFGDEDEIVGPDADGQESAGQNVAQWASATEDVADRDATTDEADQPREPKELTATDLFAAITATSITEALPGASASEAAAYDLPEADSVPTPGWPWGASAAAGGAAAAAAGLGAGGAESAFGASATGAASDAQGDDSAYRRGRGWRDSADGGGSGASGGSGSSRGGASGGSGGGSSGGSGGAAGPGDHDEDAGGPSPRAQRIMLIVAGAMLLVLLLIALFIVGRSVSHPATTPSPTPTATKTATPTPTPTATPAATGPQAPGKHPWDSLRGGECIDPFTTPWADTFTVVDCGTAHAAQMVYTGVFSTDANAAYPGADALAGQINALCSRPGVLNLDAAGQYDDAQLQGSYPVTDKQWKAGQRSYFCFVNRSSGQPITGSLQGSGPQ